MNLQEHYSKEYFEKQIKWYENKSVFLNFRFKKVFYLSKSKKNGEPISESPTNSHFLERLYDLNIIFKKDLTHIDYKNLNFVSNTLKEKGFRIRIGKYLPTHVPIFNIFESVIMNFPFIGKYFKRRFVVLAVKT